uniref:Probable inactive ATP-dependent zinc metalloprotease FTSHI 1, chloroplastic n=1 Tax=Tanacetum cinerariifolium TaxID=118510 RepID=A0A6L2P866_TANCI|nr:probable inactive ATP-dependent zinc metalloprotease FTSHI 1, chloroplastic [Tanacetum cinerariifolium]
MVELGEVTAAIAATVFVVVSGFLASAAFAVAVVHVGTVRPKNFRKWARYDIWQGIEFSQSKPQARVAGLARVTFSDVAEIEIVTVEEL